MSYYLFYSIAVLMSITIVHILGGENTEGVFDDTVRHCITKIKTSYWRC